MGHRVSPPPLYELDYWPPEPGKNPDIDYPEDEDYDYDNGIPWYRVKNPKIEQVEALDKDKIWYTTIKPKADVPLRNYSCYIAPTEPASRYIFDETGKIICDSKSVVVNMGTCETGYNNKKKEPILKEGVTYFFPIPKLNFVDEARGLNYNARMVRYKKSSLPEQFQNLTTNKYGFDEDEFVASIHEDTKLPIYKKNGDMIDISSAEIVTDDNLFYLMINKKAVIPVYIP